MSMTGSSPLTRGKHQTDRVRVHSRGLIPAHAGKTASAAWAAVIGWAHPRSRGENQATLYAPPDARGSSPLTRGKPLTGTRGDLRRRLIPAHAGKTTCSPSTGSATSAHPRSRGENLIQVATLLIEVGSSPLTRGKLATWYAYSLHMRLIPAHAGKTAVLGV